MGIQWPLGSTLIVRLVQRQLDWTIKSLRPISWSVLAFRTAISELVEYLGVWGCLWPI